MAAPQIIDITNGRRDEAVGVLAAAFAGDPLMQYLYTGEEPGYRGRLRAVFAYQCAVFLREGWPLLGAVARTRLAGVLALKPPEPPRHTDAMAAQYEALIDRLGEDDAERMAQYSQIPNGRFPDESMFYVSLIGVRPGSQGRGYARLLLERAHALAAAHPAAAGVGLDTENPENVEIYRRLGYNVVGRAQVDTGITVWCMFRPNEAARERAV